MIRKLQLINGFAILESLIVTIGVIGLLATVVIPVYEFYQRKNYYEHEIMQTITPYKASVMACYQALGTLNGCDAGTNNIPDGITAGTGAIASLTINEGVITIIPSEQHGILVTDNYIATPTATDNIVTWTDTGGGVVNGYAK